MIINSWCQTTTHTQSKILDAYAICSAIVFFKQRTKQVQSCCFVTERCKFLCTCVQRESSQDFEGENSRRLVAITFWLQFLNVKKKQSNTITWVCKVTKKKDVQWGHRFLNIKKGVWYLSTLKIHLNIMVYLDQCIFINANDFEFILIDQNPRICTP